MYKSMPYNPKIKIKTDNNPVRCLQFLDGANSERERVLSPLFLIK